MSETSEELLQVSNVTTNTFDVELPFVANEAGESKLKVYIFQTDWNYDGGAEITKVFDSKEKADKWKKRMGELHDLHEQYHRDGTVKAYASGTSGYPEIIALRKEAGNDYYLGNIVEMDVE